MKGIRKPDQNLKNIAKIRSIVTDREKKVEQTCNTVHIL